MFEEPGNQSRGAPEAVEQASALTFALASLQVELAARDKTIAVLIARVEGQFAKRDSAIAMLEQNISLEEQVKRRTHELEESHASLTLTLSELKAMQVQLLQSRTLEAIGQLAAGVAHEINTPVQYVSDNTTFLETAFQRILGVLTAVPATLLVLRAEHPTHPELLALEENLRTIKLDWLSREVPKALEESLDGLRRVASIVGAMKAFSHPSNGEQELADLHDAITSTVTVARHEWKYVAEVETQFDSAVPSVPCIRNELNQVILNLVVNAAHAIAERVGDRATSKGKIQIETQLVGDEVEIRIRDDGIGIPPAAAARVYEPFFTTKPIGKGTGQGLAIARSVIVDRHAGSLRFESAAGEGTCFFIRLPVAGAPQTPRRKNLTPPEERNQP